METLKIWEGIFPDFESAAGQLAVSGTGQGGFEGEQWLTKSVARATKLDQGLRAQAGDHPASLSRDYVLPVAAAFAYSMTQPLRVVDFGGGLAVSFFPTVAALPRDADIVYHCVENPALCEKGRELFSRHRQLVFNTSLDEIGSPADIVHAGSSLQYVADWRGMLKRFADFMPQILVLSDIPAGDFETFVSVQTYYERRMRHWFWNFQEFKKAVSDLGFDLIYRSKYQGVYLGKEGPYPMDNFPPDRRLGYASQMIFKARDR